jgi:hypothetical protein
MGKKCLQILGFSVLFVTLYIMVVHGLAFAQVTAGTVNSKTLDGVGNKITSTVVGPSRGLDTNCLNCAGGGGGTSSTFGAAFPATGTAAGFSDGTPNMRPGFAVDADTGAGTQYVQGVNLVFRSGAGPIEAGILANPLRVDPTGSTIQPVSGTVALSNLFLLDATFTARINTLGQKAMAASTPVVLASDQTSIPVAAIVSNAFLLDATFTGRFAAAFLDADTIANQTTTAVHGFGYMFNGATWDRVRGTIAGGLLVNVSNASLAVTGTFFQATQPVSIAATVTVQGAKTNNNAAPGVTNIGTLPCIANAAAPAYTEGNQTGCSENLSGAIRTIEQNFVATANNDGSCTSGAVSFTAISSNASRTWLAVWASPANTDDVYLKLGAVATNADARFAPGQPLNFTAGRIYTGIIDVFPNSGTQAVCVMELN